jgi:hypothetical protein
MVSEEYKQNTFKKLRKAAESASDLLVEKTDNMDKNDLLNEVSFCFDFPLDVDFNIANYRMVPLVEYGEVELLGILALQEKLKNRKHEDDLRLAKLFKVKEPDVPAWIPYAEMALLTIVIGGGLVAVLNMAGLVMNFLKG